MNENYTSTVQLSGNARGPKSTASIVLPFSVFLIKIRVQRNSAEAMQVQRLSECDMSCWDRPVYVTKTKQRELCMS